MAKMNRSQVLQLAKPEIDKYFKNISKNIFNLDELSNILTEKRSDWRLLRVTTRNDFVGFLVEKKILREIEVNLPGTKRKKYIKQNTSIYEIAISINQNSYLCHYTAAFIHNLTDNILKTVYINLEQTGKNVLNKNDSLEQKNIDFAFSKPMRISNQIVDIDNYKIFLLNGKDVKKTGVIESNVFGIKLPITNIERTLIDVVVRPNYAGGINEVLEIYRRAKGRFSVNRLNAMLKNMNYIYPYHQAIGFLLEKAEYEDNLVQLFRKSGIKYNFYLTYNLKEKEFIEKWKLFIPKGL